ncbi:MAG: Rieske 2Fe-2S domain-containing protein [Proteobacteria bacterium]|nr:Rieske 2Fe-2S domain-containing protein [Pseudomonadota bacterium]
MLSKKQNDLLTQTGPGTPGGNLLRSYWQPIATDDKMPPGGDPLPIRIMSEDLVLFRDPDDRLGLIGRHCPHRGTDLSYGRVEDGGLRCLYHGWAFDIEGNCIDQPAEPEDKKFCHKVRHPAYPVRQQGGVIWCYMGVGEPPLIPDFQFLSAPEENRLAFRVIQQCNWLQGLESSTDPSHTSYLHRMAKGEKTARDSGFSAMFGEDTRPRLDIEHTSFGVRIHALRKMKDGRNYLRVNNYIYPCGTTPVTESPGVPGYQGRWYVPIDDEHHCRFEFFYKNGDPVDKDGLRKVRADNIGPDGRHIRRADNRYLQDRDEQRRDDTFCGMGRYIPAHDTYAIETQGAIQDRTKEHLGSTDIVIIEVRKALLGAIESMQQGNDAPGLLHSMDQNQFPDFLCTSDYIPDGEDGPAYCRRILGELPHAAE